MRRNIGNPRGALIGLAMLCAGDALAAHPMSSTAPARPVMPAISADEEKKLGKGDTVIQLTLDGNGGGFVTGIIDIVATEDEIWKVLTAFERIPESTPSIKVADRYRDETAPNGGRDIDMAYMIEVGWVEVKYWVHHDLFPDKRYLVWALDATQPNEIKDTTGSFSTWKSPYSGRVRFLYQTRVITGRKIPKWVEEELSVQALKKYIRFVKDEAER
jgi:hypothetical protein